jgi:hypothetical protein
MRFPLDVAYLDDDLVVIKVQSVPVHRLTMPFIRSHAVLETEQGVMRSWGLTIGDQLEIRGDHPDNHPDDEPPGEADQHAMTRFGMQAVGQAIVEQAGQRHGDRHADEAQHRTGSTGVAGQCNAQLRPVAASCTKVLMCR